jgi:hypothetical protein
VRPHNAALCRPLSGTATSPDHSPGQAAVAPLKTKLKPESVERKGDIFEYKAKDGAVIPVSAPVNSLDNNGTVNNYIFNIAAPAECPDGVGVKTFLKNMEQATGMEITRDDVPAIRAYVEPPANDARPKAIENTSP